MIEAIVAGSHLRFDGVRQRPQQLLTRLAERVPVLFVEEQFAAATDAEEWVKHGALTVLRPLRANADGTQIDAATLAAVRAWLGGRCALTWLYTPMMLPLADAEPGAPIVYDCMDDLASFRFAPAALGAREPALLDRATLIFAGGRTLYERRRAAGPRVRLYPSGVEFERFVQAQTLAPHPLAA
ncbi:MAG: amine oxidase, partial [Vulcanimicrobiaceae bacterium]